jgi:hypothetical protein
MRQGGRETREGAAAEVAGFLREQGRWGEAERGVAMAPGRVGRCDGAAGLGLLKVASRGVSAASEDESGLGRVPGEGRSTAEETEAGRDTTLNGCPGLDPRIDSRGAKENVATLWRRPRGGVELGGRPDQ